MGVMACSAVVYGWKWDDVLDELFEINDDLDREEMYNEEYLLSCPYSGNNLAFGIRIADNDIDSYPTEIMINNDDRDNAIKIYNKFFGSNIHKEPKLLLITYYN